VFIRDLLVGFNGISWDMIGCEWDIDGVLIGFSGI
jgi:hypothetical protein